MTIEERIAGIESAAIQDCPAETIRVVNMLGLIASQLARIATQLEKITSLRYTEDA